MANDIDANALLFSCIQDTSLRSWPDYRKYERFRQESLVPEAEGFEGGY